VTRRILIMLLGFTAIILVGAVVPLTLNATSHDRNSFIQVTEGMARTDAAVAQARLDSIAQPGASTQTPQAYVPLVLILGAARQAGDGLLILASRIGIVNGQLGYQQTLVASATMPPGNWDQLASEADEQGQQAKKAGQPLVVTTGSRVIAAMPVYQRGVYGPPVGTVILARSSASLDNEILALWVILGSVAAAAMIAAAVLAFGLARWVNRPLKSLDTAARLLADGDLAIRASVDSGPPELRRLGTTFNRMAGRLEALVYGNRAVIADVSHQLRTPLAALRLRLDLLATDTDPETGHELTGALDELARLSRLVDGLLAVARAENVVPVPVAVDITEVANERMVAWHPVADDRSIVLVATTAGGGLGSARGAGRSSGAPVQAWIGEGHLEQILDNLIANALEALNPGNLVRLTTTATATAARIMVSDNGPGMSAEERERAFLRFTTSSPSGTGLGLAIVHRLVISNGGTARLDETPGGGLTVTLDFPRVQVPNGNASVSSAPVQDVISL
jgi:signal transduction histidine kinase